MRNEPFTPRHVTHRRQFRDPSFDLLLAHLVAQGFRLDRTYSEMADLIRHEDFYWTPRSRVLHSPGLTRGRRVRGDVVLHGGIHHVVAEHYDYHPRGMPGLNLLTEALASCSDLYFSLVYFAQHGVEHPMVRMFFGLYQSGAARVGLRFKPFFERALRDPFGTYKTCVLKFESFALRLLQLARERRLNAALPRLVRRTPELQVFTQYNWSVFVLYTLAYCGASSARDRSACKDLRARLAGASRMEDFLRELLPDAPRQRREPMISNERAARGSHRNERSR